MSAHWSEALRAMHACSAAVEWAAAQPSYEQAWDACERPDWLFWLLGRTGCDRGLLVRAACACARTVLRYVPAGEDRPRLAIEAAEGWVRGEVTVDEVRVARDAAAYAAYAYADAYAAYAAADAAAAAYAADAADAAHAAAYAAAARQTSRRECCALVRGIVPRPVLP